MKRRNSTPFRRRFSPLVIAAALLDALVENVEIGAGREMPQPAAQDDRAAAGIPCRLDLLDDRIDELRPQQIVRPVDHGQHGDIAVSLSRDQRSLIEDGSLVIDCSAHLACRGADWLILSSSNGSADDRPDYAFASLEHGGRQFDVVAGARRISESTIVAITPAANWRASAWPVRNMRGQPSSISSGDCVKVRRTFPPERAMSALTAGKGQPRAGLSRCSRRKCAATRGRAHPTQSTVPHNGATRMPFGPSHMQQLRRPALRAI